jgi:DNA repair/transcription protein MET18/MMS19
LEQDSLPNPNMSLEEGKHLLISVFLLAALRRDVPLPYDRVELVTRLIGIAKDQQFSPGTRAAAIDHVRLLANKFLTIPELKSILAPKLEQLAVDASSIPLMFSILKALVLRNAPLLSSIFPSLVQKLSDPATGTLIAHGFSALLKPDQMLTKENHCVIAPLHKQKVFALLVPDLAQGVRQAEGDGKKNYLVALSGIMRWLPFSILEAEVGSLSPLLLQTLDIVGEDDILCGTIDQLTQVLEKKGQVLEEHVGSVITRLLNLSSSYSHAARVRAKALQALTLVAASLRQEVVIPYRKQVVKKLTGALDDKKRSVRAEAVRCRTKWIELDEVGSGEQDDDD